MMQMVPKWKVTATFAGGRPDVTLWISDHHLGNVLRLVSGMHFSENGLDQPESVTVAQSYAGAQVNTPASGLTYNEPANFAKEVARG